MRWRGRDGAAAPDVPACMHDVHTITQSTSQQMGVNMKDRLAAIMRHTACVTVALLVSYAVFAASPLAAQVTDTTEEAGASDLTEVLSERGEFSQVIEALQMTGLDQELANEEQFTLFAPTDEAFEQSQQQVSEMSEQELSELLRDHLLYEEVTSQELAQMDEIRLGSGETLDVGEDGSTISGVDVVEPDIQAQNGVVHGIDGTLTQPQMGAEEEEE